MAARDLTGGRAGTVRALAEKYISTVQGRGDCSPNEMEGPGTSKDTAGRGAQGTARKEMGVLWGLNVIDTFAQSRRRGHLGQVPLLLVPKEFNKSPIKMIQGAKATEQYQPLRLTDVFCIVSSSIYAYSCALWMP